MSAAIESVAQLATRRDSPASERSRPDSWLPVDLSAALAGGHTDPAPEILTRDDGIAMLYAGKLHSVSGESESLKTWFMLIGAAQQLNAGRNVLWLDFEDTAASLVGRLLALGVTAERLLSSFRYVRPSEPLPNGWPVPPALLEGRPVLAVLDGITEAMGLLNLDPNSGSDVATFLIRLARPLTTTGAAVVMIDHVVKSRDSRGRYATGSQHKLAALDGAAFMVELAAPFGHGKKGVAHIDIAKDRPGRIREHAVGNRIAELVLQSQPDGSVMPQLHTPAGASDEPFRPTVLMERVSKWLEQQAEPATGRAVEQGVSGKGTGIRKALAVLADEGHITTTGGRNGSHLYTHQTPYRENDK